MSSGKTDAANNFISLITILLIIVGVGLMLMNALDGHEKEREVVFELKSDLISLNRNIEHLPNRQAVWAVTHMEKRLKEAESYKVNDKNEAVQRALDDSTEVLLDLHDELKERKLKKGDYPRVRIVY